MAGITVEIQYTGIVTYQQSISVESTPSHIPDTIATTTTITDALIHTTHHIEVHGTGCRIVLIEGTSYIIAMDFFAVSIK